MVIIHPSMQPYRILLLLLLQLVLTLGTTAPPSLHAKEQRVWDAVQWSKGFWASTNLYSNQSEVAAKLCKQLFSRCFKVPHYDASRHRACCPKSKTLENRWGQFPQAQFLNFFVLFWCCACVRARSSRELVSRGSSGSSCHVELRENMLRWHFSLFSEGRMGNMALKRRVNHRGVTLVVAV